MINHAIIIECLYVVTFMYETSESLMKVKKMATLTVRVDEELRERMKRLKHVNWSEVIRDSIRKKIEEDVGRNLAEAILLNEKLRKIAPEGWDSARVIREWRLKR